MTNEEYIEAVLARHELKPGLFAYFAKSIIVPELQKWANVYLNRIVYTGSMAKDTGISGTTDLDIFISVKPNTPHTLEDIYERLFRWSQDRNWIPSRQNVSIGVSYLGVKIDLVPGKLQEGYVYYHSLWKHKEQTWTQSAPEIHIDKVIESGRTREIRAIKVWRKNHGLDFPSFYLELAVMRALSGCGDGLASNVQRALGWIADNLGACSAMAFFSGAISSSEIMLFVFAGSSIAAVYDRQFTPPVFNKLYIPAESVYAVIEAKQVLNQENVIYAGKKAASVRRLRRTAAEIVDARGKVDKDNVKKPFRITAGIVTYKSSWVDPFGNPLKKALGELTKNQQIDFGISVDEGYFEVDYTGAKPTINEFMKTRALAAFLIRLLAHFQRLGTVSAIDYEEYSKILDAWPRRSMK